MFGFLGKCFLKVIGGTRNERIVRGKMVFVRDSVNPLEEQMRALGEDGVRAKADELRQRLADGEPRDAVRPEAFALIREASRRAQNHRQYDVQLVASQVLDEGMIAEEATGEGKTIACYPAIFMAALEGLHTHVVTTNDYLVMVGAEFAKPIFDLVGVSVGYITSDMPAYGPEAQDRREAYQCNVTYGTNNEFGFDYLRDNMKMSVAEQVQGSLDFAIIDEVDSILIDEARTPLIISGPAHGKTERYTKADTVAREVISRNRMWDTANRRAEGLKRDIKSLATEASRKDGEENAADKLAQAQADIARTQEELAGCVNFYEIELDKKSVHMTEEGVALAQEIAGVGSFYVGANMEWPHLMDQALRAHLVYERDKDYVVREQQVVIVDEFTGRLMEGREWSDGLHQAVCAKERVPVREENQTLATITLQNFFKLYKRLSGMTGTAMTEATEFMKIYRLDVLSIPTHRPVNRSDHNDRIYADEDAKFRAIVEEINHESKKGRPVLVGTTSIEKSERLSTLLTRTYGVEHQVLNGRVNESTVEGEIVKNAGMQRPLKQGSKDMVGMVTIATNMAGRGTDIKLGEGVVCKTCKVPSEEKLGELGVQTSGLFPPGSNKCCMFCTDYNAATNCAHCFKAKLDPAFPDRGRKECPLDVPCGLHIVATERHEARRIDNQLRGRSGRQGDPGSSRFFLSIRDELMAVFAGEWTLKVLGWLGLQGDVAIEDKRVSKGIARAQRKVEERNFEIRKNLLEYDEVMDVQRHAFYSRRQAVLEGRELDGVVMDMVREVLDDASQNYIAGGYRQRCIAEWVRQNMQTPVRDEQIRASEPDDLPNLEHAMRERAKEEARSVVSMTLGEYMDEDIDPADWDLKNLSSWAMSRFGVSLTQGQLRKMNPTEVEQELSEAACERIDAVDISPLGRFLDPKFPVESMADWASAKFGLEITVDELMAGGTESDEVCNALLAKVADYYKRREIEYPVEYAMEMTLGHGGPDNVYALGQLADWANAKYEAGFEVEQLQQTEPRQVYEQLVELSGQWTQGDRLDRCVQDNLGDNAGALEAIEFAEKRFDTRLTEDDFEGKDVLATVRQAGEKFLRREMTELERYVLLQIYDNAWKDHLLSIDHLKSGINLRSYAEQDPRVAFKREGARLFEEMLIAIADKVSDMIFKVRVTAEDEASSVYQVSNVVHDQLSAYDGLTQQAEQQQAGQAPKVATIKRDIPKVGRNDPCPCGSGKKFKKCCGRDL